MAHDDHDHDDPHTARLTETQLVDRDHGVFVIADASGNGLGKAPQHVYAVRFTARELWGSDASARDTIYLDLWDDHLDPA
jgi:nitrile hydratase subunit beta